MFFKRVFIVVAVGFFVMQAIAYCATDTWTKIEMPDVIYTQSIAIDPTNSNNLYVRVNEGGGRIYVSKDGGNTWFSRNLPSGEAENMCNDICIDPANPQIIYIPAVYGGGVLKSVDGGYTWEAKNNGIPDGVSGKNVYDITIDPQNHNNLYAADYNGIYKTVDGGDYWSPLLPPRGYTLQADPINMDIVYAHYYNSIIKSIDGGTNWSQTGQIDCGSFGNIEIHPFNANIVYISSFFETPKLFVSSNGGDTWINIDPGTFDGVVYGIAICPWSLNTVYVATSYWDGGIYKTSDRGQTWVEFTEGLPEDVGVNDIAIGMQCKQTIYAATDAGLYKRIIPSPVRAPVYRFFNTLHGGHFYTINDNERDYIIENLPHYSFEGIKFFVYDSQKANTKPVFRFFNTRTGIHLYTISEIERDYILGNLPHYRYEGIKFYVYGPGIRPADTTAVYRFFHTQRGCHLYTTSEVERDYIIANMPQYAYEGIKFYVFP